MYVSPRHPNYEQLTAPRERAPAPEPTGRLLLALPRPGRGRGPDGELRVYLDEYQSHPYISVRLWNRGDDGWYPSKKGCSIRISECEDLAAALDEAARLAYATPAKLNRM